MVAISSQTRQQIKGYLEGFIQGLIDEYKGRVIENPRSANEYLSRQSSKGELKPFQAAIISSEIIRINQFERGLSTRLGTTLEECARLIALEHHQQVNRGYDLTGSVSNAAYAEVENQIRNYESISIHKKSKPPSLEQMIDAVFDARQIDDLEAKKIRVDLYLVTQSGIEFFFEMKAPKPNKGQCLEVTQRLLRIHLLRGKRHPEVQAYYAMSYNPYGSKKADYKWSHSLNYMPFEQAVVIGQEFWNIIGGITAYEELLEIYQEVGQEKSKYIMDALALEF